MIYLDQFPEEKRQHYVMRSFFYLHENEILIIVAFVVRKFNFVVLKASLICVD